MRKIPTLFARDPEDRRYVVPEVHPECRWVLDGEGVATRKYDGTCVLLDGDGWWARREVKAGKAAPGGYRPLGTDPVTGKTMGWEPIAQSSFAKAFAEVGSDGLAPGTYELCGPKINGNPEGFAEHVLIPHGEETVALPEPLTFETLRDLMAGFPHEGVVWHHADGRRAKLKAKDFPRA